ncbi:MAG: ACT domain-containing protein [Ruminococcaceae bacterium]|nr:ACT domain-containing protein [Oscillospiraceae bacterium]
MDKKYDMLIVKASALPDVFSKVVYAKELLENGICQNISEAVLKAGISRSAFYKYKDFVSVYKNNNSDENIFISATLSDRAGVFSALTAKLYEKGVNILTINQKHPINKKAEVTLTVRNNALITTEDLLKEILKTDGVISAKIV